MVTKRARLTGEQQQALREEGDAAQAENVAAHATEGGNPGVPEQDLDPEPADVPSGPLGPAARLRVMSRIMRALEGLPLTDQRGVIGLLSLAGSSHQAALRQVLTILRGVPLEGDRKAVIAGAAAVIGSAPVVAVGPGGVVLHGACETDA